VEQCVIDRTHINAIITGQALGAAHIGKNALNDESQPIVQGMQGSIVL